MTQLIAECAIGLIGVAGLLPGLVRNSADATKVLRLQISTYQLSIRASRSGNDARLRDAAEYVKSHPNDVPDTQSKDGLASFLSWAVKEAEKAKVKLKEDQ